MLVSFPAVPSVVSFRSPWGEVLSGRVRVVHRSPSVLIGDDFDEAEFPLYEVEVSEGSAPGMWNVPSGWVVRWAEFDDGECLCEIPFTGHCSACR